jgi:PEGA domain-containing protein
MKRIPFAIALGFASVLAFSVTPASAQSRSGGSRTGGARYYAPVRFVTPYYTFEPRFSVGFGLFIGYPVAYGASYYYPDHFHPYAYAYLYAYRYPYSYPSPNPYPIYYQAPAGLDVYTPQAQNSVGAQPGLARQVSAGLDLPNPPQAQTMGGLSFEIAPSDARVIIDGDDVGDVGQFTPRSAPLGLRVGRHHLDIVANGYRTMSSDVDVRAGEVIPLQGQMER